MQYFPRNFRLILYVGLADEDCINVLRYIVRAKPHKVNLMDVVL
jgi:hypothetical protein